EPAVSTTDAPIKKPQDALGFVLSDVARLIRRNFNRQVQKLGLTQAQWQVLAFLARNEGVRQIQLADSLDMQPISVARIIDRMQASGWVERRPDPTDRRAFNLYLTAQANPILEQMWDQGAITRAEALKNIPAADQDQLLRTLLRMRENLGHDTGA
ncbi:MAG TPA: MarR family transcriptional regulator, partial [Candidatus Kapabacteria bacterium]|nr:MarR family transcriptional regulator [Candidatus Kapabacteria bacterium]